MQDWVPAVIAASSALVGAGVGGAATFASQRAAIKSQAHRVLAAELSAYGYALDALRAQVTSLPRSTRTTQALEKVINAERTPNLNGLLAWANAKTVGRDALVVLDHFLVVSNRLLLVAPEGLIPLMDRVNGLLAHPRGRDDAWQDEWSEVRSEIAGWSRRVAAGKGRKHTVIRLCWAAVVAAVARVRRYTRASPS